MLPPDPDALIAAENARILNAVFDRICKPVPGGAFEFLEEQAALRRAAESDGIEAIADPVPDLARARDEAEAERFRIEIERDAALPDEDI
jgi:methylaspartate ammonia-lyase